MLYEFRLYIYKFPVFPQTLFLPKAIIIFAYIIYNIFVGDYHNGMAHNRGESAIVRIRFSHFRTRNEYVSRAWERTHNYIRVCARATYKIFAICVQYTRQGAKIDPESRAWRGWTNDNKPDDKLSARLAVKPNQTCRYFY